MENPSRLGVLLVLVIASGFSTNETNTGKSRTAVESNAKGFFYGQFVFSGGKSLLILCHIDREAIESFYS